LFFLAKEEDNQSPENVGTLLFDPQMGRIMSEADAGELQKCLRFRVEQLWSLQEKILFEVYIRQYGKNFSRIQDKIQTKGIDQIIDYYYWRKLAIKRRHPLILKFVVAPDEEALEPFMDEETKKQLERDRICTFERKEYNQLCHYSSNEPSSPPKEEDDEESEDDLEEPSSNLNPQESESDSGKIMKGEEDDSSTEKPQKHKLDSDCYYDVSVVVEDIAPLLEHSTNEEVENFLLQRKKVKRDHLFDTSSAHYPASQTITTPTSSVTHELTEQLPPSCVFPTEDSKEDHEQFMYMIMGSDYL